MKTHTPGPWVVDWPADGRATPRVTTAGPMFEGATSPVEICKVSKKEGKCGSGRANASLIAAAPELLEALKKMLAAAKCHYDPAVALSEYGALAEVAIARAEGGQP